jgi:hypothetical protein
MMLHPLYEKLREVALAVAATLPPPAFLRDHAEALRRADDQLAGHELIGRCRGFLDESRLECAHGVCHCEAVARDAGALVIVEGAERGIADASVARLSLAASIAGLLHDIKRREEDHAARGSVEAGKILAGLGVDVAFSRYVSDAIRNHEAFREPSPSGDVAGSLVSDALYDADKFRWGPENFTTTLWLIVGSRNTPPEELRLRFPESMRGIDRIKASFRTATGRKYGPEYIDQGLEIGRAIYRELSAVLDRSGA